MFEERTPNVSKQWWMGKENTLLIGKGFKQQVATVVRDYGIYRVKATGISTV
jgi:hypothetical protein